MFYGENEVVKREDVEGGAFVTIKDGETEKIEFLTTKAIPYSLTEEKKTKKELDLATANAIQEDILSILKAHDTNTHIAEFVLQQVGYTLQQTHYGQLAEANGFERNGIDEQQNVLNGMWKKLAESLQQDCSDGNYQAAVASAKFSKFTKLRSEKK